MRLAEKVEGKYGASTLISPFEPVTVS